MKMLNRIFLVILCASTLSANNTWAAYTAAKAPFSISVNNRLITHDISFISVLPKETVVITSAEKTENLSINLDGNSLALNNGQLKWIAPPQPEQKQFTLLNKATNATITLHVFILHPAKSVVNGKLNGYTIGSYPPPLKGLNSYKAPQGFIEVTKANKDTLISPHFTLGQFLCKQASGYPKYVVLNPLLLEKLELLLEEVNAAGIKASSFHVMSGYRTPHYNKAIGNVPSSRHVYGGAADIFVDSQPQDQKMDDINKDGKINIDDAKMLYAIADKLPKKTGRKPLIGGVGLYKSTAAHGPFVHVDVRGTRARW